jgi:RNA polymerase sigma factor (sigma-70 family)
MNDSQSMAQPLTGSATVSSDAAERDAFAQLAQGGGRAEAAIGSLYQLYAPRFRAFLRMRGVVQQQAEDVVHDVFVRVIEAGAEGRLHDVESPRAYLWSALRNAFTDWARRAGRDRRRFAEPPGNPESDEDGGFESWLEHASGTETGEADRKDHVECVARAFERFRRQEPERATAIELAAIEGFEGRELAQALGKSHGAAREFLSQARRGLKALIQALCGGLYA